MARGFDAATTAAAWAAAAALAAALVAPAPCGWSGLSMRVPPSGSLRVTAGPPCRVEGWGIWEAESPPPIEGERPIASALGSAAATALVALVLGCTARETRSST